MPNTCKTCRYAIDADDSGFTCCRYPTWEDILGSMHMHWCGEYEESVKNRDLAAEAHDMARRYCNRKYGLYEFSPTTVFASYSSLREAVERIGGWTLFAEAATTDQLKLRAQFIKEFREIERDAKG